MKIIHKIGLRATVAQRDLLDSLGVKLAAREPADGHLPLLAVDVAEDHPSWGRIQELIVDWGCFHSVTTKFTGDEIADASWVGFWPKWHNGYPEPSSDGGYLQKTYDLSDWCDQCGVGLRQKNAFCLKGEPKWGKRNIFQVNWVFDESFVSPALWSSVFERFGVGCRPVKRANGVTLNDVVQLEVENYVSCAIGDLRVSECPKCGRPKYDPVVRGYFPSLLSEPTSAIVRTRECFGGGRRAYNWILVSQELARALTAGDGSGVSFWPVQT